MSKIIWHFYCLESYQIFFKKLERSKVITLLGCLAHTSKDTHKFISKISFHSDQNGHVFIQESLNLLFCPQKSECVRLEKHNRLCL